MLKRKSLTESMIQLITESDDFDDICWNAQSAKEMKRIGRRVVIIDGFYGVKEYKRFPDEKAAEDFFDDERFPSTGDSVIYESFERPTEQCYEIQFADGILDKYNDIRHAATYGEAVIMLRDMHEEHGEFQPSWFVNDYGTYELIG